MSILPEEQRVRAVLRELSARAESEQVKEDADRLQKLLEDPLFRQLSRKSLDKVGLTPKHSTGLAAELRAAVEKELSVGLKENQRLCYAEFELSELRPVLLDSGDQHLLVVGPKDVKARSSGRLRIGDRIRALLVESDAPAGAGEGGASSEDEKGGGGGSATEDIDARLTRRPTPADFERAEGRVAVAVVRESAVMVLSGDWTQVEVIRLSTEGAGLGFGIVGGASTGVVVKTILPGSPADKDKRLLPGDHILQIGHVSTHGMSSQQVASILRQQDSIVEMIVGRPINYADRPADTAECWTMATRAALNSQTLDEFVQRAARASPPSTSTTKTPEDEEPPKKLEQLPLKEEPEPETSESKGDEPTRCNGHEEEPTTAAGSSEEKVDGDEEKRSTGHDRRSEGGSIPEGPCNGGPRTPTTSRISLRTLQEMALTVFLRENWQEKPFATVLVTLERDPALGLGITVAGYVHRKEEIGGVFVKSLVPRSAASQSGRILVHDLIVEVNGISLEGFSHADSVRTLVKSGPVVNLKLVRFPPESAQAQCLRMLHEQETDTQVIDVQSSNPDLVAEWKRRLNADVEIISAVLRPDRKDAGDGGLGISLEGTVDILNGLQLCPHHYIEGLRADGPAAKSGLLQAGDELLQVNHSPLYGESHVTVRQALSRAVNSGAPVTLVVARRTQHVNVFQPSTLPLAYPLLASGQDRIVKAKSEINLKEAGTDALLRQAAKRLRSRSLEPMEQLAIWNCVPLILHLDKDVRGLGFSVVDYQDPSHPGETVIVVQSLVPGGVAQADGRIVPGDRLLFVNNHDLSNSSLERAVAVLKAAPQGRVRLGIAKPVPVDQCAATSHSPLFSRSERLLARGSSPRGRRRKGSCGATSSQETVWIGADDYRRLHPQGYYPSSRSPSCSLRSLDGTESMTSWSPCSTRSLSPAGSPLALRGSWAFDVVYLPTHLERSIKLQKGAQPLGVVLDAEKDKGVNGCVIKSICGKKAVGQDERLQVGDFLVKINTESLRNVTSSQARAILKRTNLVGTQCNITYITAADAKTWKERFGRETPSSPVINRLSPKVFPKFYRSPYLSRKSSFRDTDEEPLSEASDAGISEMHSVVEPVVPSTSEPHPEKKKERAGRLVDGFAIDELVNAVIEEALQDAILELAVSHKTPDWNAVRTEARKERSPPATPASPPPSRVSSRQPTPPKTPSPPPKSATPPKSTTPPKSVTPPKSPPKSASPPKSPPKSTGPSPPPQLLRRDSEPSNSKPHSLEEEEPSTSVKSEKSEEDIVRVNHAHLEGEQPSTSSAHDDDTQRRLMKRLSSRTASSGSETIQVQAKQLTRSKFWGEARTVVLHREPNKSFGISIVGGRVEVSQKGGLPGTGNTVSGIFIKSVLPNSPAGKSGGMNMGDRVISVNDVDLREATHEQAVAAIKNASNPVKFVLQSLHSFTPPQVQHMISSSSNSTVGSMRVETYSKAEGDTDIEESTTTTTAIIEERPKNEAEEEEPIESIPPPPVVVVKEQPVVEAIVEAEPIKEPIKEEVKEEKKEETPKRSPEKELEKRNSIVKEDERKNSVKRQTSDKKKGSLRKKNTLTEEDVRKASFASGPLIVSDVSSSETHDDELACSSGIDATSAALADDHGSPTEGGPPSRFGYTKGKLKARYGHMEGDVVLVDCDKVPEAGLGISLAGNKDRDKLNIFVVNVKVACPLAIKKGDEILEVNGRVLRGISHLSASNIIRECCSGHLEMIVCRREGALSDCAVQSDPKAPFEDSSPQQVLSPQPPVVVAMPPTNDGAETALQTIEAVRKKSFSIERTAPIEIGKETLIEIDKEGKGLGLSIVGGSDTVLGAVVIHEVYSDGAAAHDGRLKPGDQVLEVNKTSLRGMTHDQAISTLRRTPPKVRLMVYRDVNLQLSLLDPTQIYNMFEVELTKKPGRGLGLSIVGRKNEPGVYVSEVVKGGTAEADGRLMPGDQILSVNGQDVANSMQEDVAAMLKTCVGKVTLKIGRWKLNETTTRVHAAAEAASLTASTTTPRVPSHHSPSEPSTSSAERQVPSPAPPMPRPTITHTNAEGGIEEPADLSPVQEEASSGTDHRSLHEEDKGTLAINIHHDLKEEGSDTLMVELKKVEGQQLGMGIGKRSRGILVTSLQPGSAAAEKLRVGDRILAVNALPVTDQLSAVTFVKASNERLFLQIARPRNPS